MNLIQIVTTIVGVLTIMHFLRKDTRILSTKIETLETKLSSDLKEVRRDLSDDIKEVRDEVKSIDRRLIRIEDRIEFSGKTIYIQRESDEAKEN